MQEVVDSISKDDEIYSISFKVSIITTSIGLNFKFVENISYLLIVTYYLILKLYNYEIYLI